jgi:hypothetical protein
MIIWKRNLLVSLLLRAVKHSTVQEVWAEDEISAHILCECEALTSFRHVYLSSFCLEQEDIKSIILGAFWHFSKATALP